jgi:hypothetical protein
MRVTRRALPESGEGLRHVGAPWRTRCYCAAPSADESPNGGAKALQATVGSTIHCICRLWRPRMGLFWVEMSQTCKGLLVLTAAAWKCQRPTC